MPCSTKPRVDFISTLPEFYAIKLSKKHFEDLCSKLTLIDVFGHMSRFHNCFQLNKELLDVKPFTKTFKFSSSFFYLKRVRVSIKSGYRDKQNLKRVRKV